MLAQYPDSGSAAAIVWVFLVGLLLAAAIPAAIASSKGYSAVGFYFFGLFFFLPALIVALVLPPKPGSASSPRAPAAPTPAVAVGAPAAGSAPPPGPGVVRECPHCKEPMRRDAGVCPHCRRESPPWEYSALDSRWWATDPAGNRVWLDEREHRWRQEGDEPKTGPATWSVILHDLGTASPDKIRKLVHEFVPERFVATSELESLPMTLCARVGYATASGLRGEVERSGATCEVRED